MPRRKRRVSLRRRIAARKAWDTRTRNEGVRQALGSLLSYVDIVGKAKSLKDIIMGVLKIAAPRLYRKHRLLKRIDKAL